MSTNHPLTLEHASQSLVPKFTLLELINHLYSLLSFEFELPWKSSLHFLPDIPFIEPAAASQGPAAPHPQNTQKDRRITCKLRHPGHVTHLSIWQLHLFFLCIYELGLCYFSVASR